MSRILLVVAAAVASASSSDGVEFACGERTSCHPAGAAAAGSSLLQKKVIRRVEPSCTAESCPYVGCMKNQGFTTWKKVKLTEEGAQSCLEHCKREGHMFAGLSCPKRRQVRCACSRNVPSKSSYWGLPHYLRYSNNTEMCTDEVVSKTCPGPFKVGRFFLGGKEPMALYGLRSVDEWTSPPEDYTPIARIPVQDGATPDDDRDASCADVVDAKPLTLASVRTSALPGFDTVIASGTTVLVDASAEVGNMLVESGATLMFKDQAGLTVGATGITVRGALQLGQQNCPFRAGKGTKASPSTGIILRGPKSSGGKGIVVESGGSLDVYGFPFAPTWTRLQSTAMPGDTDLQLQQRVNWEVGQQVVVITTTFVDERRDHQNEVRELVAVDGDKIRLDKPLEFLHYGGPEYFGEVALLSRSVKIEGDEQSDDDEFGGHTVCMQGALCRLSYVHGHRLGQKNVMGRYPFHLHMMGDVGYTSMFTGVAVTHSFFRAYTIHGTSSVNVTLCVAFNITGSAMYLEDGVEENNNFEFNLVAHVHVIKPFMRPWKDYTDYKSAIESESDRIVPTDLTPSAFYCTNLKNRWVGNVASGGFAGFTMPTLPTALGLSLAAGLPTPSYKPHEQPLQEFDGNTCHSAGQWWYHGACIYIAATLEHPDESDTSHYWYWYQKFGGVPSLYRPQMTLTNTKMYASRSGLKAWGIKQKTPGVTLRDSEWHDTMIGVAFFGHNEIANAVFSAHTSNVGAFPVYTPAHGFQTYDNLYQTLFSNVAFRGYQGPADVALYSFIVSDCCVQHGMLALSNVTLPGTLPDNTYWFNPEDGWPRDDDDTKGPHGFQYGNAQDIDGSLTGISGGAILGARDSVWCKDGSCGSFQWWRMDDDCEEVFTAKQSRGYWACPRIRHWAAQDRTVVAIFLAPQDATEGRGVLPTQLSDLKDDERIQGTVYHFGHNDRRVMTGWSQGRKGASMITGPCCDVGWFLAVTGGARKTLSLLLGQMVPTGGMLFATRYPPNADITVEKCFDTSCSALEVAETKGAFLADTGINTTFIDETNTVFIRLVNERNNWFDSGNGAFVLNGEYVGNARYVLKSNLAGVVDNALPPEDWADSF